MISRRLFFITMTMLGAAVVAAGWWTAVGREEARLAERAWQTRLQAWQALDAQRPPPLRAVADARLQVVADANAVATALAERLNLSASTVPTLERRRLSGADAVLATARYIESQHTQARAAGVTVPDDSGFGFSAYAHDAPDTALMNRVMQQQEIAARVLAALWAAKPDAFIRLQREDPANGLKDSPRARNRSGLSTDYFAPEAAGVASIRIDGFTTLLFRVGFSGDTATLRDFVEGLRQVALPIVIHEISVDSRRAEASGEPATRGLADLFREDAQLSEAVTTGAVPVIAGNTSQFWVTLKCWVPAANEMIESEGGDP